MSRVLPLLDRRCLPLPRVLGVASSSCTCVVVISIDQCSRTWVVVVDQTLVGGDTQEEGVWKGCSEADPVGGIVLEHLGDEIKHVQGVLTVLFTVTLLGNHKHKRLESRLTRRSVMCVREGRSYHALTARGRQAAMFWWVRAEGLYRRPVEENKPDCLECMRNRKQDASKMKQVSKTSCLADGSMCPATGPITSCSARLAAMQFRPLLAHGERMV